MNKKEINPIALALGVTGMLACSSALAGDSPFSINSLPTNGVQVADSHGGEGSCGEGKCGEGQCGEDGGGDGDGDGEGSEGEGEEASEGDAEEAGEGGEGE